MVCRANICRSPVAEALLRQRAVQRRRRIGVASAGVEAPPGLPADGTCQRLLQARGLSLAAHRSVRFSRTAAMHYDLILVMEEVQRDAIRHRAPLLAGRVQCLGRWTVGDIADPTGGTLQQYLDCLDDIEDSLLAWLTRF